MVISKSKSYLRSYNKIIIKKNLIKEQERISKIENVIIAAKNLQDVMNNPFKNIYHIEQKKWNLKEYFTARVNEKIRLIMKPIGEYPYNKIEIDEIEFINLDDKHYGEG